MNKRVIRIVSIFVLLLFGVMALASCGKKGSGYVTKYAADKSNNAEAYDDAVDWAELKVAEAIIDVQLEDSSISAETRDELNNLKTKVKELILNKNSGNDYTEVVNKINSLVVDEADQVAVKNKIKQIVVDYADYQTIAGSEKEEKVESNYKVILIKADVERFNTIIDNASSFTMLSTGVQTTGENIPTLTEEQQNQQNYRAGLVKAFERKTGCLSGGGMLSNQDANALSQKYKDAGLKDVNIYEALVAFMVNVDIRQTEQEPIFFKLGSVGDFFKYFFNNFFVFPVGIVLHFLTSIFGGWYIIGLFITTMLIRTAGWPIYAKTNDMSLKMQVLQPEMQKINDKYANRQDPDSQRMKQAEIGQLYKKNKVGIGGCFLPFLQFPIFMAVYGAVRRFPYTVATEGTMFNFNWAQETIFGKEVNSTLFGIPFDLFEDYTAGKAQLIGIIILVILVCGTQFLSQFLSERRQKKNNERQQEDIPAYRRQAYKSQNGQSQNTMKYVMYMMIFMMGTFVLTSKAGLGVYWLIGNLYSMLQMFINNEMGQRKLKKMRENKNQYR